MPSRIETLTSGRDITDAQFAVWLKEERQYLKSKESEPEEDILGMEYVDLLMKYTEAK